MDSRAARVVDYNITQLWISTKVSWDTTFMLFCVVIFHFVNVCSGDSSVMFSRKEHKSDKPRLN
ncbi:hypothetical protein T11_10821 [Trichinella zimbabwensis]|uniref:Transmembrane protein n=1 Tax=Trichinella zimbabwensis TaxID=268475 RepID=A0A0V1HJP6_9BILA|nr:hypothetical protein T11_10821 [Trichinella zimbabwensis]